MLGVKYSSGTSYLEGRKWRHKGMMQTVLGLARTTAKPQSTAKAKCCNLILAFAEMELQPSAFRFCSLAKNPESFLSLGACEGECNIFTSAI